MPGGAHLARRRVLLCLAVRLAVGQQLAVLHGRREGKSGWVPATRRPAKTLVTRRWRHPPLKADAAGGGKGRQEGKEGGERRQQRRGCGGFKGAESAPLLTLQNSTSLCNAVLPLASVASTSAPPWINAVITGPCPSLAASSSRVSPSGQVALGSLPPGPTSAAAAAAWPPCSTAARQAGAGLRVGLAGWRRPVRGLETAVADGVHADAR